MEIEEINILCLDFFPLCRTNYTFMNLCLGNSLASLAIVYGICDQRQEIGNQKTSLWVKLRKREQKKSFLWFVFRCQKSNLVRVMQPENSIKRTHTCGILTHLDKNWMSWCLSCENESLRAQNHMGLCVCVCGFICMDVGIKQTCVCVFKTIKTNIQTKSIFFKLRKKKTKDKFIDCNKSLLPFVINLISEQKYFKT